MNGEVSVFGVFLPALLLLGAAAAVLTAVATRLLALVGAYRLFAYRPLVDVALFVVILGALALVVPGPSS